MLISPRNSDTMKTDNTSFHNKGARAVGDMLKTNTTLKTLSLWGESQTNQKPGDLLPSPPPPTTNQRMTYKTRE